METVVISAGGNAPELADRPIVIGHSVGGLLAQIFAARNLVSYVVPICPGRPI